MEQSSENRRVGDKPDNRTSEELIRLHRSLFRHHSPLNMNKEPSIPPPSFEFKKVSMWDNTPCTYSTSTDAKVGYA